MIKSTILTVMVKMQAFRSDNKNCSNQLYSLYSIKPKKSVAKYK